MNTHAAHMLVRMRPLSPRLRVAHLRALIRQEPTGLARRHELVALLRDQLAALPVHEDHAT